MRKELRQSEKSKSSFSNTIFILAALLIFTTVTTSLVIRKADAQSVLYWSQYTVELSVPRGGSTWVNPVSFVSTEDIENLTFDRSSNIAGFLNVYPNPMVIVPKNTRHSILFSVNIPADTPAGVYQGNIQPRVGGQPLGSPLTVVITVIEQLNQLQIQAGSDTITINQGSSQNVVSTINLTKPSGGAVNITNTVSITPNNGGLTVTSDYPAGGYNTSAAGNITFVLNQSFNGVTPGIYTVTNTATITGSNPPVTASDTITVEVLPPGGNPVILPVGANPDGVRLNTPTQVTFTATAASFQTPPASLALRRVGGGDPVIGTLLDDGNGVDLQAGDGVYSGQTLINEPNEGLALFRASGFFPGVAGERFSDNFSLVVTCFPTIPSPPDPTKVVFDPEAGASLLSDEVLVTFAPNTTCAEMTMAAGTVGGTIVGSQPGLGLYQIKFPGDGTPQGVYSALSVLQASPLITFAMPNLLGELDEVTPNDPDYALQYAPQKIRADEAWVIARGGPVIAVVDSGVDYNHPDLAGKVIKGHDYVNGDEDPADDNSHGTHVAGIAAAKSNNGQGIAGIAWDSRILAIKVFPASGSGASALDTAAAIKEAADKGAKVINCSFGFRANGVLGPIMNAYYDVVFTNAVNYATAKGSVVVAAAGNNSSNAEAYPCAVSSSFCVGSTDSGDNRSGFSNFGPAVDIAAPGTSIFSTIPGGMYDFKNGTSMASPYVAGSVAVVQKYFPSWTNSQVRERLQKTSVSLSSGLQLGSGRVDLFEAVFNGSFEDDMKGWKVTGTAGAVQQLGSLMPVDRKKFGFLSSGPDNAQVQTTLEQSFTVQPGVTNFVIKFDYDFVSEEWPEFVGQGYNDNMRITLVKPDGSTQQLAFESIDGSAYTLIGGIDFPGGDTTVGHTGYRSVSTTVPVTAGAGVYRIVVRDEGDGIYDSQVLIDKIRFK